MINQQIADWIKSQEAQGYTPEQIYSYLTQQGYDPNEVTEAINLSAQAPAPASPQTAPVQTTPAGSQQTVPAKKSKSMLPILIVGIIVIAAAGGGAFYFLTKNSGGTAAQDQGTAGSELALSCDAFPGKLESCTKFKCQFTHPITGELMVKEILGLESGKCSYTEQMPNNGRMDCKYTESMRKAVAEYYTELAGAQSSTVRVKADLVSGKSETKYTIDGKEVSNPLQEAMTNGQCVISGY